MDMFVKIHNGLKSVYEYDQRTSTNNSDSDYFTHLNNSNGDNTGAGAPVAAAADDNNNTGEEKASLDPVRVEFNKGDEFVKAAKGLSDWLDRQNLNQTIESLNSVNDDNNNNNNNINTDEDEENVNMMASIASEHKKLKTDLKNGVNILFDFLIGKFFGRVQVFFFDLNF